MPRFTPDTLVLLFDLAVFVSPSPPISFERRSGVEVRSSRSLDNFVLAFERSNTISPAQV